MQPTIRISLTLVVALATVSGLAQEQADKPQKEPAKAVVRVDPLGDPLPPGALMRLGTTRFQISFDWNRHLQADGCPYTPVSVDGGKAYLVYHTDHYVDNPRTEYRWIDAVTGKILDTWPMPKGLRAVGTSADGRRALLLSGTKDSPEQFSLHVYDVARRQEIKQFHGTFKKKEHQLVLHGCCFSADGNWLATVEWENCPVLVRLWNVATGKEVWSGQPNQRLGYRVLGFTPDNAKMVLQDRSDGSIHVLDPAQAKIVSKFPTGDRIWAKYLSPDGKEVLCTGDKPGITLWDVATGKKVAALKEPAHSPAMVTFAPDGKTLLSTLRSEVAVRDWPSGKVRRTLKLDHDSNLTYLSVSADGRTLNALFQDLPLLCRYDLQTGKPLPLPIETHVGRMMGLATAPDGAILSLGEDNLLRTWDLATDRLSRQPQPLFSWAVEGSIASFAFSPDGKCMAVASPGASLLIFDNDSRKQLQTIPSVESSRLSFKYSPDGRWLATGQTVAIKLDQTEGLVEILDATTYKSVAKFTCDFHLCDLTFSPDSQQLICTNGLEVQFWDTKSWKKSFSLPIRATRLFCKPDGLMVVCFINEREAITLLETASRKVRAKLPADLHGRPCLSPDGRFLAAFGRRELPDPVEHECRTIEVWDLYRGTRVATFEGHEGDTLRSPLSSGMGGLTFSSDGKRLISADDDSTLLVWDVAAAVAKVRAPAPLTDKEMQAAWENLASEDAEQAFQAVMDLSTKPEQGVAAIRAHLKPVAGVDAAKARQHLAALDSKDFVDRQRATAALEALDTSAERLLEAFLAGNPPLEAQRRANQVLTVVLHKRLRELRAIEVLECIGTPAARVELERLARGAADAGLTRDAAASLRRLEARK